MEQESEQELSWEEDLRKMSYLFGPVLSRRLGLSMGVDLLKYKTCNLDCVYCELGRTVWLTRCRGRFVPPEKVLREIRARRNDAFDHLTFAGSGEPTLSSDLGKIVRAAKKVVDVPVAVITNSTLLTSPTVRRELASADVILPSLDAATAKIFQRINRPAQDLQIDAIIDGLKALRNEFGGEIWLEVMLVKGVNEEEAELISRAAESTSPDRIQLNTVVRPPAEPVLPLSEDEMQGMLEIFPGAELIPDWDWSVPEKIKLQLRDLLSERSCTLEEMGTILDLKCSDAIKYCKIMERDGLIKRKVQKGMLFFFAEKDELA